MAGQAEQQPGGVLGAMSVVAANSWMNTPAGYTMSHGKITSVDPLSVYFNASTPYETAHMVLAAYMVAGFIVAGVYAVGLLRGRRDRYHRLGFAVPFTIAGIAAPLQVMMGDIIARFVANNQPVKFAAMEYVPTTTRDAAEWIGGILINGHVYFGAAIPAFDSILVGFNPHTRVIGWDSVPPPLRPPLPTLIHLSFDLMVGIGFFLFALAAWQAWWWWFHRRLLLTPWFLVPAALSGVAAVAAMEAGWIVTEVGRQPWIVYHVLLVSQAVTPSGGVPVTLGVILVLYAILTVHPAGNILAAWTSPTAILTGFLFVAACAYISAVYLVIEARQRQRQDLVRYFALRATAAGVLTGALAGGTFAELANSAPYVYGRLTGVALPLVAISIAAGIAVLGMLRLRWHPALFLRATAAIAVATVVFGWGLAQYPYLFPTSLSLATGSAPSGSLVAEFVVTGLALLFVAPGFALLYVLQQRRMLTAAESDTALRLAAHREPAIPGQSAAAAPAPAGTGAARALVLALLTVRAIRDTFSRRAHTPGS